MIRWIRGFFMSMGMFCIIPIPFKSWDDTLAPLMMPTFPIVGAVIGGLWYAIAQLLMLWDVPLMITAALLAFCPYILTGFIHLDGYMDTCDAILSRRDLEEKRRILKDPHTGAFAVILLAMLFVLAFSVGYSLLDTGKNMICLWMIPIVSRAGSAISLLFLKPIAQKGYGYLFSQNSRPSHRAFVIITVLVTCLLAFLFTGWNGLVVLGSTILGYVLAMCWAYRSLGGVSGDLAGFALTISEFFGLFALALI